MSALIAPQRGQGPTGSGMGNRLSMPKDKIPSGYKMGSIQQFTPEQMQLFQSLFSQLGPESSLAKLAGGDQSQFEQMEAPALRQFGELQGNLASRFSGMGMGARNSSGFQNTMNTAASNFAQDLQSQRLNLQRQALNDLMNMSNQLLGQRPVEKSLIKKQLPWWQQGLIGAAQGFGQGAGKSVGSFLGGFGG